MTFKAGLPKPLHHVYTVFHKAGFDLYLVGGIMKHLLKYENLLEYKHMKDWDLTTNATPEQMLSLFPDGFYNNQFGTVGIPVTDGDDEFVIEVTTFRSESEYKDRRHPEKVEWGKSIEEDVARRDFTINAIVGKLLPVEDSPVLNSIEVIDLYNGQQDFKDKIIRAVGDPDVRFKEDALRMMRAVRFAVQMGFTIDPKTLEAITRDSALLSEISYERIYEELMKILASDYPYEGVMLLKNTNLLQYILPELLEGIGLSQERPGRHHKDDVFTHNVLSLKYCPSTDPLVRFATLIHDVGKPRVQSADEDGLVIFYNHEIAGARLAYQIAERLRFSKKDREKIVKLVRWHMFTVDEKITDAAVRRFIRRIGVENVQDMMDLRVGDRLGGGTQTAESWRLKLFKRRLEEQLAPEPFSIKDLAINGHDIMQECNLPPGREIGVLQQKLFEEVDEDLEKNTKEYLLKRVKELLLDK